MTETLATSSLPSGQDASLAQDPPLANVPVEELTIPGLRAAAEIVTDRWGIAHIRAGNPEDLFFLQGFNAARDRLWQIDLWRKRGLGLLAADFGPGFLEQDIASRHFLYRGDMAREWAAYSPDAEAICKAFTAGINAYIDLTEREPDRLPPEFVMMATQPARWAPEDVVRIRSHGLTRNALSEVLRAIVLARADLATDLLRKNLEPPITPKPELDLASIPLAVLDTFKLATAGVTFSPERMKATLAEAKAWRKVTDLGDVIRDAEFQGSNNWVVHGSRTATSRPILANDPHRAHSVPSLRMLVHLTAPGFDAIGAGEPVIPGISIGHNGHIAFGLTIFYSDQEDVYVYETDPADPKRYHYGAGYQPMRIVEERFAVRGEADQIVPIAFTRHGPVVHEEPEKHRAYAIRSVWFQPGAAAYFKSIASMRSTNMESYRAHMRGWGVPSVNHVYADTKGHIAWMPSGFTPIRPNWDGLTPVPGDGRYEWKGFLDHELLPRVVDPDKGYFATANEMNLPPDYPHETQAVGYEWVENFRTARIHEVLDGQTRHTVAQSCALQTDVVSMPARRIGAVIADLDTADGTAFRALGLLRNWDHSLSATSPAAALFEVWWTKHLKPALISLLVPDAELHPLLVPGDIESLLHPLENPEAHFRERPAETRDALLAETLASAFRACAQRMGEDPSAWPWGKLHQAYFEHPLSPLAPESGKAHLDIGPLPHAGSSSTPMHTGYRASDFRTIAGASVRLVIDVGQWDNSVAINAPGQSGDPRSPHYRDLAPLWARGEYVPLLYSREAVDAAAAARIVLKPA